MCKKVSDGYIMDDGTKITANLDINSISPTHIEQLDNQAASAWDILLLRKSMHTFGNEIQKMTGGLLKEVDENYKIHHSIDSKEMDCKFKTLEDKIDTLVVAIGELNTINIINGDNLPKKINRSDFLQYSYNTIKEFHQFKNNAIFKESVKQEKRTFFEKTSSYIKMIVGILVGVISTIYTIKLLFF